MLVLSLHSNAQTSQCFYNAKTHYEKVYCEIKDRGRGKSFPAFNDFKKNTPLTQSLLLKRDAEALNIPLKLPQRSAKKPFINKAKLDRSNFSESAPPEPETQGNCSLFYNTIKCQNVIFHQVSNQTNKKLKPGVLENANKIGLKPFLGDKKDRSNINAYLYKSYTLYIEKMIDIGLGSETMSFTKFNYLFNDNLQNNIDFASRFETMFSFLKTDKQTLAVNTKLLSVNHLSIADCFELTSHIYVCDNRNTNYVFLRK